MARCRRHKPIAGISMSESESDDKRLAGIYGCYGAITVHETFLIDLFSSFSVMARFTRAIQRCSIDVWRFTGCANFTKQQMARVKRAMTVFIIVRC